MSQPEKYGLRACYRIFTWPKYLVEYLGHVIDKEGIHPVEKKEEAILAVKPPKNIEQLQSYVGIVNYYGKFIPNLSIVATPLTN